MKRGDLLVLNSSVPGIKPITVMYMFVQKGVMHIPDIVMFDLMEPFNGYPAGTTLGAPSLKKLGFII